MAGQHKVRGPYLLALQSLPVPDASLLCLLPLGLLTVRVGDGGGGLHLIDLGVLPRGVGGQLPVELAAQAGWPEVQLLDQLALPLLRAKSSPVSLDAETIMQCICSTT